MRSSRAMVRLAKARLAREYNQCILDAAQQFQPDFLLAFKGAFVFADTLRRLRAQRIPSYNYFPDRMAMAVGTLMEEAMPEYDCVFDTKEYWDGDTARRIGVRTRVFVRHGYDPEIHHPIELQRRDLEQYGCEVSLVTTHMPMKEDLMDRLLQLRPKLHLNIWGNQWEKCRSGRVQQRVRGRAMCGLLYTKIIRAAQINLGVLGVRPGVRDETTTRTFEIPACGGFMLHERTPELAQLFEERREVACFGSPEELAEKIDYYLAHPEEREAIARAGHARCVPAYSYDNRMRSILEWHRARCGGPACAEPTTASEAIARA